MQGEKRRVLKTEIKASQTNFSTSPPDAPKQGSSNDSESFYNKLSEVWESHGLGLIINARETLLDLYLFYSEVTRRGGYHQVSRDRKWDELVSALQLEGSNVKLPVQLEKCYALLLYQFEQLYHYRDPAQKAAANTALGLLTDVTSSERKRKSEASLSELMDDEDGKVVTKMCKEMTGAELAEQQVLLMKKRRGAPRRHRTAYQIFLKQECARLRSCNEASAGSNMLHMAIDAWKKMSKIERQPFVEESKKEKERLMEEMNTQNEEQNIEAGVDIVDYHVTLQPEAGNSVDGLALKMSQEEPKDPLTIDCDAYFSLGMPTEGSK